MYRRNLKSVKVSALVFFLMVALGFQASFSVESAKAEEMRSGRVHFFKPALIQKMTLIRTLVKAANHSRYEEKKWNKRLSGNPKKEGMVSRDFEDVYETSIGFWGKTLGEVRDKEGNVLREAQRVKVFKIVQHAKIEGETGFLIVEAWKHPQEKRTIIFSFTWKTYKPMLKTIAGYRFKMKFPTGKWEEIPFVTFVRKENIVSNKGQILEPVGKLDNDAVLAIIDMIWESTAQNFSDDWMEKASGKT